MKPEQFIKKLYMSGKINHHEECLKAIKLWEKEQFNKYPEKKPPKGGSYIVQLDNGYIRDMAFSNGKFNALDDQIVYWREYPKH